MQANPKVSIIIPVFDLESTIGRCIESCVNQTFKEIEIVVINDGSQDGSREIIEDYARNDFRIKLINKANEGVNTARKIGAENSDSDYLFFLDGDDTIPSDAIGELYTISLKNNAQIAAGNIDIYQNGKISRRRVYSTFGTGTGGGFLEFILGNYLHYLCGKLIRREFYLRDGRIFNKKILVGEDQIQLFQLCLYASTVVTINHTVYNYFINENSVTQKVISDKQYVNRQRIYAQELCGLLQSFNYTEFVRFQINLRILEASRLIRERVGLLRSLKGWLIILYVVAKFKTLKYRIKRKILGLKFNSFQT